MHQVEVMGPLHHHPGAGSRQLRRQKTHQQFQGDPAGIAQQQDGLKAQAEVASLQRQVEDLKRNTQAMQVVRRAAQATRGGGSDGGSDKSAA